MKTKSNETQSKDNPKKTKASNNNTIEVLSSAHHDNNEDTMCTAILLESGRVAGRNSEPNPMTDWLWHWIMCPDCSQARLWGLVHCGQWLHWGVPKDEGWLGRHWGHRVQDGHDGMKPVGHRLGCRSLGTRASNLAMFWKNCLIVAVVQSEEELGAIVVWCCTESMHSGCWHSGNELLQPGQPSNDALMMGQELC